MPPAGPVLRSSTRIPSRGAGSTVFCLW